MSKKAIIGVFAYADDVIFTIEELAEAGFPDFDTYSPVPSHDIEHAVEHIEAHRKKPPFLQNAMDVIWRRRTFQVGRGTAVGAFVGAAAAITLVIGTKVMLSVQTGGMPIIPLPPMGLLVYELGTLFATLGSLAAFLYLSRMPRLDLGAYSELWSDDKFGVVIKDDDDERLKMCRSIMEKYGAETVEIVEVQK